MVTLESQTRAQRQGGSEAQTRNQTQGDLEAQTRVQTQGDLLAQLELAWPKDRLITLPINSNTSITQQVCPLQKWWSAERLEAPNLIEMQMIINQILQ
jgi:hypothetical protein